jgi:hydrogenase maturation protease
MHPSSKLLVLGYGNTLRGDDGVGLRVVEAIADLRLDNVETLTCPQLTPELAEPVSRARLVIFVDAAIDAPRRVQLRRLSAADSTQVMAHAANPRTILALARDIFGCLPEAWWLTIPIKQTDPGEVLSPVARRGGSRAIRIIQALAAERLGTSGSPGRKLDRLPSCDLPV